MTGLYDGHHQQHIGCHLRHHHYYLLLYFICHPDPDLHAMIIIDIIGMVMVIITILILMLMLQAMNQLSAETTVDARSFMVYVERPEEEVKGEIVDIIIIAFSLSSLPSSS